MLTPSSPRPQIVIFLFIFPAAAVVFFFVLVVRLFPQENSEGNRPTRGIRVKAFGVHSVHSQWYALQSWAMTECNRPTAPASQTPTTRDSLERLFQRPKTMPDCCQGQTHLY